MNIKLFILLFYYPLNCVKENNYRMSKKQIDLRNFKRYKFSLDQFKGRKKKEWGCFHKEYRLIFKIFIYTLKNIFFLSKSGRLFIVTQDII